MQRVSDRPVCLLPRRRQRRRAEDPVPDGHPHGQPEKPLTRTRASDGSGRSKRSRLYSAVGSPTGGRAPATGGLFHGARDAEPERERAEGGRVLRRRGRRGWVRASGEAARRRSPGAARALRRKPTVEMGERPESDGL
ncbi:hypothetical protein DAI22_02g335200 [Oryza sativa Japonica Group]|nr:hypothetical protein DAI22_02g335200 [Oryza sativa Japonica Group]